MDSVNKDVKEPRVIHRNPELGRCAKIEKRRKERAASLASAIKVEDLPEPTGTIQEAADKDTAEEVKVKVESKGRPDKSSALTIPPSSSDTLPQIAILYVPNGTYPTLTYLGMLVEVRIQAKYLSLHNREVSTRQLWGTDIYTEDSDAVAILRHCGRIILRPSAPTGCLGVSVVFRVLPSRKQYLPSTRYGYRSRQWNSEYSRTSLEFVRSETIYNANKFHVKTKPAPMEVSGRRKVRLVRATAPIDRPKSLLEQPKPTVPGITVTFNAANDPVIGYSLAAICDRGMDEKFWTSTRLKKEVLYLESQETRFELSRCSVSKGKYDLYRWSKVLPEPLLLTHISSLSRLKPIKGAVKRKKSDAPHSDVQVFPLPLSRISVLENDLDWDEIEWGPDSVRVRGQIYRIKSLQFKAISV